MYAPDTHTHLTPRMQHMYNRADPKVEAVVRGTAPNVTFHVEVNDGGLFSLYFVSCEPGTPVSLRARVAAYNLVGPTGRRDYLSVGEGQLDTVYWVRGGEEGAAAGTQAMTGGGGGEGGGWSSWIMVEGSRRGRRRDVGLCITQAHAVVVVYVLLLLLSMLTCPTPSLLPHLAIWS